MYSEVTWVLVSSGTQVLSRIIFDPDYLPDSPSVSYDYENTAYEIMKFKEDIQAF